MSGTGDKYPMYHLYAVVVHLGVMNGAYSGHYVSYVKNSKGHWFRLDDSRVSYLDTGFYRNSVSCYFMFSRNINVSKFK